MKKWVHTIRLSNGEFPRFNDSPFDICLNIDEIIEYSDAFLYNRKYTRKGTKSFFIYLLNHNKKPKFKSFKEKISLKNNHETLHYILKDTGWIFLKEKKGFEIVLKCGIPCPKSLGAHVHSDLLSFELFKDKIPIITETGTSTYTSGRFRSYERSSNSHNTIQL